LRLRIEPSSGVPISRQIADQIRSQCVAKTLKIGDRVPSVRELARELAVNQNTILHVYERLTAEGWLETRQGSGTYVKSNPAAGGHENAQTQELLAQLRRAARQAQLLGISAQKLHDMLNESMRVESEIVT
jgi:DNA-binding transcriptional regulator YhcF (GntR family)